MAVWWNFHAGRKICTVFGSLLFVFLHWFSSIIWFNTKYVLCVLFHCSVCLFAFDVTIYDDFHLFVRVLCRIFLIFVNHFCDRNPFWFSKSNARSRWKWKQGKSSLYSLHPLNVLSFYFISNQLKRKLLLILCKDHIYFQYQV